VNQQARVTLVAVDSARALEYAVAMANPSNTDLESNLRRWIKKKEKESSRLEFKLKLEISNPGGKAEFVRDVIALANSGGEAPRDEGHLVIGFSEGRFHDKHEHYEGATLGQILDSHISPAVNYALKAFEVEGKSIHVLVIRADTDVVYVVNKKLQDDSGRVLLSPGQSWGRKADRKIDLSGGQIHERIQEIARRQVEKATEPLRKRIKHLERNSGPALEVKRIRFEMERDSGWDALDEYLDRLMPYAREFDDSVKDEVLDAVMEVTGRTKLGMPAKVAQSVDTVLLEVMPVKGGGFNYPAREPFSERELELLKRIEHAVFEMTWDACRYLRDIEVVAVCARLYWYLIRFTTLNKLQRLQSECLHNVRYARSRCAEERNGKTFPEAHRKLSWEIRDALDAFECEGYEVTTPAPSKVGSSEIAACLAIIETGEAVDLMSAKRELPLASALALAWKDKQIVGVGAIKRERREYAAGVAEKSGVEFPSETLELGYVAVAPEHRGHHLSDCLIQALLKLHKARLFATTYSEHMKDALIRADFRTAGKEWKGRKFMLSLWLREE
jgi:GNAT superfamily N-acetyltransferase